MAKAGSVVVAMFAVIIGLVLGFVGVTFLMENDSLAQGSSSSSSFLGLWGESQSSADMPTAPWMGLVFLVMGGAVLLFGLRALFTAFEGRSAD